MSEQILLENLQGSLRLVTELRAVSAILWQTTADGMGVKHGKEDGGREKRFLSELKSLLDGVGAKIGELDQSLNAHQHWAGPFPLGQSLYLSLDSAPDSMPIYNNLVMSYRWLDRAHDYAGTAATMLSQNSLNRSYGKVQGKNRKSRPPNNSYTAPPAALDNLILGIGRLLPDMTFNVTRPNGTKLNALVEVTLDRVLKAVLIFKGLMIEWVVVKGFAEESVSTDGVVDVWSDSRYKVFRKITENANAAMLNFQSPVYPEVAIKSFMTYLHSFVNLFTDKCKKCGCHLHNYLPPTWREFKTLEPFHEDCRP